MRELTSWEIFQIEKWGNILEVPDMEIEEPGETESEQAEKWIRNEHEKQLNELQ